MFIGGIYYRYSTSKSKEMQNAAFFLKITLLVLSLILSFTGNLPHTRNARFDRKSRSVMEFIFVPLIQCRWASSYDAHITSLCQLRNNFFSKISHKAQYYQLTLKISTKKEPLISQKSQTLRFYLYSISPNCTILA